MNDRIISFWQSVHNLPVIKIIYYSETSCSKTIMADVNRENHTIERLITKKIGDGSLQAECGFAIS